MNDLRERTIRGALARLCAQAANLLLRIGAVVILARLLQPSDFGLIGMVTAFTGILNLLRDFGLSAATVQRADVTNEQKSTLFWINILVGAILTALTAAAAPVVASFYHEPRLFWVTLAVAAGFIFNAVGIQHSALLQRQMRFTALSFIDITALVLSTAAAILAARAGYGYWALVAMTLLQPLITSIALWRIAAWTPGRPHRSAGIRSLMRFGGTITLNGVVVYIACNFDKILLGRFWGATATGIYGRAYQLIRIPTDSINSAVGEVAFSALSRLQDDPPRLKSYFLKGYSLVVALTLPATLACGLFADDLISVLLGPKWKDATIIFRLLAPTILVFAIANPVSWLVSAIGMVGRGLKMSSVIAPVMILSYFLGLPYGPRGVACAYSLVMLLWVAPVVAWSVHGTVIRFMDIVKAISQPVYSSVIAGLIACAARAGISHPGLLRLAVETTVLLGVYFGVLLYIMRQKEFYFELCRKVVGRPAVEESALASA